MQVIGNVGDAPTQRNARESGREFDVFFFAENHQSQQGAAKIPATWYDVSAFVPPEQRLLIQKGAFLKLTGRLTPSIYYKKEDQETKQNPQISLRLMVFRVEAMPRKDQQGAQGGSDAAPAHQGHEASQQQPAHRPAPAPQQQPVQQGSRLSQGFDDMDDDIPF